MASMNEDFLSSLVGEVVEAVYINPVDPEEGGGDG